MIIDGKIISKILFKDVFNDKLPYMDTLKDIIISNLSDSSIEFALHVIANPDFEILSKNDYFKVRVDADGVNNTFNNELDILTDMGLYENNYIYGKILDSDDYGVDYTAHYYKMKVQLFTYDQNLDISKLKELKIIDTTVKTWDLIKVTKSEIKYFKHGTNKSGTS